MYFSFSRILYVYIVLCESNWDILLSLSSSEDVLAVFKVWLSISCTLAMTLTFIYAFSLEWFFSYKGGKQIQGAKSPWLLNFARRLLIFTDLQYETSCMLPLRRQNFEVAPKTLEILCAHDLWIEWDWATGTRILHGPFVTEEMVDGWEVLIEL